MNDVKMSRKLVLLILVSSFVMTTLVSRAMSSRSLNNKQGLVSQSERVRNINTSLNYTTIQEAIDADETEDGHTIFVEEGIYYEHVVVNKAISLVGENKSTTVIDGNETASCVNITANNVAVTGFTVQKSRYGIVLENSSDTLVSDNIVSNNDWGIYAKSDNNSIVRNVITHSLDGINLRGSYTTVAQNNLSSNSFAIYTYMCANNTIVSNKVSNSPWGIELVHSDYSMVIGNIVSYSNSFGIGLAYCSNNTIYHNNFINNADQVFIHESYNNTWDNGYPSGGNYWSDYTDVDLQSGPGQNETGSDGIWDHPYTIYANNPDNYPLTEPWASLTITIISPQNKTYATTSIPLTFTVNKTTSWVGYSLNGQANVTITGNTTLPVSLQDGSHSIVVCANDTFGDMGSSTVYFTVDTVPPNITDVFQFPEDDVLPEDIVKINATVIDVVSGVEWVALNYTNSNGTWVIVEMTNLEGNIWNATIPAFPYGTNITYTVIAEDNVNNTITTEKLFGYQYQYEIIPEFPSLLILLLFMITTLLAVITYRRKHSM